MQKEAQELTDRKRRRWRRGQEEWAQEVRDKKEGKGQERRQEERIMVGTGAKA